MHHRDKLNKTSSRTTNNNIMMNTSSTATSNNKAINSNNLYNYFVVKPKRDAAEALLSSELPAVADEQPPTKLTGSSIWAQPSMWAGLSCSPAEKGKAGKVR